MFFFFFLSHGGGDDWVKCCSPLRRVLVDAPAPRPFLSFSSDSDFAEAPREISNLGLAATARQLMKLQPRGL